MMLAPVVQGRLAEIIDLVVKQKVTEMIIERNKMGQQKKEAYSEYLAWLCCFMLLRKYRFHMQKTKSIVLIIKLEYPTYVVQVSVF